jgi:death on curing protein
MRCSLTVHFLNPRLPPPAQQFDGKYVHDGIADMAAAYAFHICMNHPFIDGNKWAATAAMIAFLCDNGWLFEATTDQAEPIIMQLAAGQLDKPAFTERAKKYMRDKTQKK